MPDRTVTIKDSLSQKISLKISTLNTSLLSLSMWQAGNYQIFKPSHWGGTWSTTDLGNIKYANGLVWYKRAGTNFREGASGIEWDDVRYIDVFLYPDNDEKVTGLFDWGIMLDSFICLNSGEPGAGDANISQQWAMGIQPGNATWVKEGKLD